MFVNNMTVLPRKLQMQLSNDMYSPRIVNQNKFLCHILRQYSRKLQ